MTQLATTGVLALAMAAAAPVAATAQQSASSTSPLPVVTKAPLVAAPTDTGSPVTAPQAPETGSSFDAKFSAGATSDYNYRGYTLSDHNPSASANVEADYKIFFGSVNTASVQMPKLSHFQMTDTVGIRPVLGALTVEAGSSYYSYPGGASDPSYAEFYLGSSYALIPKLTIGLNFYYAPNYYRMGIWENCDTVVAKYDLGRGLSFSAELGRQSFGTTRATASSPGLALPDYTYGSVGFSYVYASLTFDLRYHATTLSRQSCFLITGTGSASGGSNGCQPTVVATLSWNAGLAELKSSFPGSR